jgi:hypothetical protein
VHCQRESARHWTALGTRRDHCVFQDPRHITSGLPGHSRTTFDGIAIPPERTLDKRSKPRHDQLKAVLRDTARIPELLHLVRVKYDSDEAGVVHS